jgi:hypothetical protein
MQRLAETLSVIGPTKGVFHVKGISEWINSLRDRDADGQVAETVDVVALCGRHAAVWERLHIWLTATDGASADVAAGHFDTQLEKLTKRLGEAA